MQRRGAGRHSAGEDADASGAPAPIEDTEYEILDMLRALPDAFLHAPLLWVPRPVKQQVGSVLRWTMDRAIETAGAEAGDKRAEVAHRLCRAAPQLLLRKPSTSRDDADEEDVHPSPAGETTTATSIIRERVKLALAGKWKELVSQLLEDVEADREKAATSRRPAQGPRDENGNLTKRAAQAAVVRARSGALRAAASALLGGPPVPPGPDTDAAVKALFRTEPLDQQKKRALDQALDAAAGIPPRRRLRVTHRLVGHQVCALKAAAGTGPSGWRNSHIQCVYADSDGPRCLAAWFSVWAHGQIQPWLAELWTPAVARPFWKTSLRESVRPVLCGEALLKLAMGVCVRGAGVQVEQAVGPRQFGAGRSGGASLEISEVRAAAKAFPERMLMGLDVRNAFGEGRWVDALLAAVAKVPKLAVPLAAMWRCGFVRVFLLSADSSEWQGFLIFGSLIQGNLEGQPGFCIVIAVVYHVVSHHPSLVQWRLKILHWIYVDDWVIMVPIEAADILLRVVEKALSDRGLPLQRHKCAFHVPALRGIIEEEWPQQVQELAATIPHNTDGLTLLGTEACGDRALPLYEPSTSPVVPAQTRARVAKALRTADVALELIAAAPQASAKQAACAIARCIVARSIDYDAGVLPSSLLLPYAEQVTERVHDVIAASMDVTRDKLDPAALAQTSFKTHCAGLQVEVPSLTVPMARAARLIEDGPALRGAVREWADGLGVQLDPKTLDGVDAALGDGLLRMLADRGIAGLGGGGCPIANVNETALDPLRPAQPERHLLSAYMRHSSETRYQTLLDTAIESQRVRLRSAAGPTAGSSLVARWPRCHGMVSSTRTGSGLKHCAGDWAWHRRCPLPLARTSCHLPANCVGSHWTLIVITQWIAHVALCGIAATMTSQICMLKSLLPRGR